MSDNLQTIILGGGCFWCIEAVYQLVDGVVSLVSGYSAGQTKNPTYKQICQGDTGHAEVVKVEFDSSKISLEDVLDIFWDAHDPTTLNRQGNDVGTQYRSIIIYTSESQKPIIEKSLSNIASLYKNKIVTEVVPLDIFYPAEDYHQDYYRNNPLNGYCHYVISPKVSKIKGKLSKAK